MNYNKRLKNIFLASILINSGLNYCGNVLSISGSEDKEKNEDIVKKKKRLSFELIEASKKGDDKKVQLLISKGVDVNAKDNDGWTPLMFAAYKKFNVTVSLLINAGADVNLKNHEETTALMLASLCPNNILVSKLLIESRADINARNNKGDVALIWAIDGCNHEEAFILLQSGAKTSLVNNKGKTVLDYARDETSIKLLSIAQKMRNIISLFKVNLFEAIDHGTLHEVKKLIMNGTLHVYDHNGNNPLHIAALKQKTEIFKLILNAWPKLIKEQNKYGQTPIEVNPIFIKLIVGNI